MPEDLRRLVSVTKAGFVFYSRALNVILFVMVRAAM
jgi:hypothetical protein